MGSILSSLSSYISSQAGGFKPGGGGGGGGTRIYGLYRYVPRDRVCSLRFSVLK